jgi:hypothetical protein
MCLVAPEIQMFAKATQANPGQACTIHQALFFHQSFVVLALEDHPSDEEAPLLL